MTFDLHAHDAVLPAGRVLGLVLTLPDTTVAPEVATTRVCTEDSDREYRLVPMG